MEHVFQPDALGSARYALSDLSWQEWTTIRRLRANMTKAELAEACGVSRTTLWRALECPQDNERWLPLTADIMLRVEAALDAREAQRNAAVEAVA